MYWFQLTFSDMANQKTNNSCHCKEYQNFERPTFPCGIWAFSFTVIRDLNKSINFTTKREEQCRIVATLLANNKLSCDESFSFHLSKCITCYFPRGHFSTIVLQLSILQYCLLITIAMWDDKLTKTKLLAWTDCVMTSVIVFCIY